MFVVAMSFISCSKDDAIDPLVGTWTISVTEDGVFYLAELTFNSDNTGNYSIYEDGIQEESNFWTWSTSKNILTVIMDEDPTDIEDISYSISGNELTIEGQPVYTRK